jgi:hypothetical protein
MRRLSTTVTLVLLFACGRRMTPGPEVAVVASTGARSSSTAPSSATSAAPSASTAGAEVEASAPATPLGPPGASIALAREDEQGHYRLLLTEAGKKTTFTIYLPYAPDNPPYRHVDVDGDGRAGTLARVASGTVVLTPPPGQGPTEGLLHTDLAATILAVGSSGLDEVVARAKAIPNRGVSPAQACALITRARTRAGFRAVAAPDARLIVFFQPNDLSNGSRVVTLAEFDKPDPPGDTRYPLTHVLAELGREACKELFNHPDERGCDKSRPVCAYGQADGDAWVFAWTTGGQMRLQAATFWAM